MNTQNPNQHLTPRILIVSFGSIGKRHYRNVCALLPQATVGIFSHTGKSRPNDIRPSDEFFTSWESALTFGADVAIIASPATAHLDDSKALLANGTHLFIEKPLCATQSPELTDFRANTHASTAFTMVGYILRFSQLLAEIKEIIDAERFGKVRYADVMVGQFLPDWRPSIDYRTSVSAQRELGGGVLLELSHEIDYATWLFGQPDGVACITRKLSELDIDVEDYASIRLTYGADYPKIVNISLDFLRRQAEMRLDIVFENATLTCDLITETAVIKKPKSDPITLDFSIPDGNEIYLRQFDLLFFKSLTNYAARYTETENAEEATVGQSGEIVAIIEQCRKSADGEGIVLEREND